jgi:DNA-binding MarR family transcriptional regulator
MVMAGDAGLGREVTGALGYLFKHAHRQYEAATAAALAPFGIDPRAMGVLRVLTSREAGHEPTSQQDVAHLLGVDRTTMVALLDTLEHLGIVARRPQAGDRRRNVVELTAPGRDVLARAEEAVARAEQEFLAPLAPQDAQRLRDALHVVVTHAPAAAPGSPADPRP